MSNVFVATVLVTSPAQGVALVVETGGSATTKPLILAHLPFSDGNAGAAPLPGIEEGTAVICVRHINTSAKAYILGPANNATADLYDSQEAHAFYHVEDYSEADDHLIYNMVDQLLGGLLQMYKNQDHGSDIDAIAGDYDIVDRNGNCGIHIGRLVAQLRGSPLAFIDVSGIKDQIRLVAQSYEQHTPSSYSKDSTDLHVKNTAVTSSEAFGLANGNPFEENLDDYNDPYIQLKDDAIPLYRLQEVSGKLADGKESKVVAFPIDEKLHTANTEPPILEKERVSLSGEVTRASALGMTMMKTPAIRGIHQLGYDTDGEKDDILTPYEMQLQEDEEQAEEDITDAAINKIIDKLLTGDYLKKLQEAFQKVGLKLSSTEKTLAKAMEDWQPGGMTTDQHYGLPPSIKLTDPVTGRTATYYASTSFISEEPDGSILICDGYGSEIRMSRGNIYLSPALDLISLPGRDFSAMVPRHASINAQYTVTMNSSGSMYLRAVEDWKAIGATGGTGMTVLENRATNRNTTNGLLLRSLYNWSATGNDIYIGRNTGTDTFEGRVSEPVEDGSIIIDAGGNGLLSQRSAYTCCDTRQLDIVASYEGEGAVFSVQTSGFVALGTTFRLGSDLMLRGSKDRNTATVYRNGEEVQININVATAPMLSVEGQVQCDGAVISNNGARFAGQVVCRTTLVEEGGYGETTKDSMNLNLKPIPFDKLDAWTEIASMASNRLKDTRVYQDSYVNGNAFSFPPSYEIASDIQIPGTRWQADTIQVGNGGHWKEDYIISVSGVTTAAYPGWEVWENATVSKPGHEFGMLKTDYTTNTKERPHE